MIRFTLIFFVLIFSVSGCKITPVSDYDEQTDVSITSFHKDLITFFNKISGQSSPACLARKHQDFYKKAKVDLHSLLIRTESIPNNSITSQQVSLLINSLDALEGQHSNACMSQDVIGVNRGNLEVNIRAILKLELAKKRGQ